MTAKTAVDAAPEPSETEQTYGIELRRAAHGLHRRGLARAADAARAHPRAPRLDGSRPVRTCHELIDQARAEVENAGSADRRDPLPLGARERQGDRRRSGTRHALPVLEEIVARARGRRRARRGHARVEGDPLRRPAAPAAHAPHRRREPGRERDPLRGYGSTLHALGRPLEPNSPC